MFSITLHEIFLSETPAPIWTTRLLRTALIKGFRQRNRTFCFWTIFIKWQFGFNSHTLITIPSYFFLISSCLRSHRVPICLSSLLIDYHFTVLLPTLFASSFPISYFIKVQPSHLKSSAGSQGLSPMGWVGKTIELSIAKNFQWSKNCYNGNGIISQNMETASNW